MRSVPSASLRWWNAAFCFCCDSETVFIRRSIAVEVFCSDGDNKCFRWSSYPFHKQFLCCSSVDVWNLWNFRIGEKFGDTRWKTLWVLFFYRSQWRLAPYKRAITSSPCKWRVQFSLLHEVRSVAIEITVASNHFGSLLKVWASQRNRNGFVLLYKTRSVSSIALNHCAWTLCRTRFSDEDSKVSNKNKNRKVKDW